MSPTISFRVEDVEESGVKRSTVFLVFFLLAMPAPLVAAQVTSDPDEAFRWAIELFEARQYPQSRRILESLTKTHPTRALYWFNLANSNYMLGDYEEALEAYRKVIALESPLALSARLYIGKTYRKSEAYASAVRELKTLGVERLPPGAAMDVKCADDAFARQQRRADYGQESFLFEVLVVDARVGRNIPHDDRLSRLGYDAGDALP